MTLYDLIIRNGTLVSLTDDDGSSIVHSPSSTSDIAISDGKIAALAPALEGSADEVIDARGLHIFPGVVDAHVHFNEPGRTDWEGFASGTSALAAGGTTTFFDMPLNSHPPTIDAGSFRQKLAAAEASSIVDFGLWGGIVPGNLDNLEELAELGVVGFKAFMSNSGIEDFEAVDDLTLYQGMERAAKWGRVVAVHAENDSITSLLARQAVAQGRTGIRDYLDSRPIIAELEAIERAILFAEETGCPLHIVHVSSGRGVSLVAEARRRGVDVSCETCPHYLVLTDVDVERLGAVAKCAPPLRPKEEQEALWNHIIEGTLPMVASDHSPSPPELKDHQDFFKVWGGISGCQSLLQLMLTKGHHSRNLSLTTIAGLTSTYPAHRFGISKLKGYVAVGADADLVMVDLHDSLELRAADLLYRHSQSPFVGMTLRGRIDRTLVRGETVYKDGKVITRAFGRIVRPNSETDRVLTN